MSTKAKNSIVKKFLKIGLPWAQAAELSKSAYYVVKNATGIIVPAHVTGSAATWSQTGTTVTVTSAAHTIPATVYDGYKVYLSSATTTGMPLAAGLYDNFARTGTGTYTFTVPATMAQTATGTVTTNITETVISDLTTLLPANAMGLTGRLRYTGATSNNNNAGTKTCKIKLDTQVIGTVATTTAVFGNLALDNFFNRGTAARNVIQSTGVATAVDTSTDLNITVTLQNSAADQFVALDSVLVELIV
jgi:hypothetical protein